jgi:cytochrome c oxidase assembly protein subunit 15
MDGALVPPDVLTQTPWWRDLLYNLATIQFTHRTIAWVLLVSGFVLWWKLLRTTPLRGAARFLLHALTLQFALGVATLLLRVPIPLAVLHQAGAVVLLAAAVNARHAVR